jgi:pimeloyl-ACP methyl ester carboxylesterase
MTGSPGGRHRREILQGMEATATASLVAGDEAHAGAQAARTIVMLHGAFAGSWTFDVFRAVFEELAWTCHAPDLPHHGADKGQFDTVKWVPNLATNCSYAPRTVENSPTGSLVTALLNVAVSLIGASSSSRSSSSP